MALPSRFGDRLPALFPSRAVAPTDSITWIGYGSYDQSATTAYSSFSNRGLTSLEQFPARFYRHFTTYFSERSRLWMESHPYRAVLRFALRWTHLSAFGYVSTRPTCPRPCLCLTTVGRRGPKRLHLAPGMRQWPRLYVATRK